MNKVAAKKSAESFEGTFGDLLAMIDGCRRDDLGVSAINSGLTHAHSKQVLRAAVAERDLAEKVTIWRPNPYKPGQQERSRDAMIVQNIFRECA